ncbi:uncharacterized protein LOC134677001 [Cydia fagiglandana]|uniref:uncharacterized protein LOC134677001 n=1 Tax=Cydia fagiglandana TaxID=1458189 RepID=UPI002FEE339E
MGSQSYHQREMEERIRKFDSACVAAVRHIGHLQEQARSFLGQLSCEPREFKHRFLQCSRQLDEFMYAVTDFNLAASSFDTNSAKMDIYHPVPPKNQKHPSELSSSHSNTPSHSNMQKLQTKDRKSYNRRENKGMNNTRQKYKRENWRESTLGSNGRDLNKMDGNETVVERNEDLTDTGCQPVGLPPQPKLDPLTHEATIVTVEGAQLWIVADDTSFFKLMEEMLNYYQNREMAEDFIPKSVCAYYDDTETKHYLRALYITSEDGDPEVFLVDTGEFQPATQSRLYPLAPQFATTPPLAHLCYLADVDQTEDKHLEDRRTEFLQEYLGQRHKIKLVEDFNDDGSLQSLGVYVFLDDGTTLNERVQALDSNDPELNNNCKTSIDNESICSLTEINKMNGHTQNDKTKPDENESINVPNKSNEKIGKDICTERKISEENKIMLNEVNTPYTNSQENKIMLDVINTSDEEIDKYTNSDENNIETDEINDKSVNEMDLRSDEERVEELKAIENINLDEMKYIEYENAVEAVTGYNNRDEMDICKHYRGGDSCFKGNRCNKRHVKIHPDGWTLDRVSVHVKCPSPPLPPPGTWHKVKVTHVDDTCQLYVHFEGPEEPMSLADLVDEMSLAADNSGPLKLVPAPGELVSAPYEGSHYRARVIASHGQIEVFYIDYGNTATVSISGLRPLEPRWLALPARAVPCRLAGVSVSSVSVSETLKDLALNRTMQAQIIARGLDEVTVKVIDADGFDVGEQLAVFADITLQPYDVEHDERRCVLVPA